MILPGRLRRPILLAALGIAVVVLYVLSPYVSLWRLQRAAERNDAATLEELIDFAAVRASLKEQATGEVRDKISGVLRNRMVSSFISGALGSEVVNRMIDERVTPEGIARMIKGAQLEHSSFSGLNVFTFQTRNFKGAARFTGLGWRVYWVELPGLW